MLNKYRSIISLFAIVIFVCACSRNDASCYWLKTDNDVRLWTSGMDTNAYHYYWKGESFAGVIHGNGVLYQYCSSDLLDSIIIDGYYGSLSKEQFRTAKDGSVYIGEYNDNRNGFGVLIKDKDVYVGCFKNGRLSGRANKYHDGKLVYTGDWRNNKFNGYGIYINDNGQVLKGKWKANKLVEADIADTLIKTPIGVYRGQMTEKGFNGHGTMRFNEGGVYEGEWRNGAPNGNGTMVFPDSSIYKGNWVKGEIDGLGTMAYSNGDVYSGDWKSGQFSGNGRYVFASGGVYDGIWIKGKQYGKGHFSSQTIRSYNGSWEQGQMVGDDTITYYNGDKYYGSLVDNKREGNAAYKFSNGNEYHGQFADDTFNGLGVFTFHDGNRYEGEFAYGKIAGEGTLYYYGTEDTVLITAYWNRDDMFPAMASMLFANGDLYEGEIIDGQPSENGTWTNVRFKEKSGIQKANDYNKRHKSTFDKVMKYAYYTLGAIEVVAMFVPYGQEVSKVAGYARKIVSGSCNASQTVFSGVNLYEAIENSDREDIAVASTELIVDFGKTYSSIYKATQGPIEAGDKTQLIYNFAGNIVKEKVMNQAMSYITKYIVGPNESKIHSALINKKTFGRYVVVELYSDDRYHKNIPNDTYAKF